MAYQHNSDGPHADKGVFIAKCIAYIVVLAVIIFGTKLAISAIWGKDDSLDTIKLAIESEFLKDDILTYSVITSNNAIEVTYWNKGIVAVAAKADQGDDTAIKAWNIQKEKMQYMASVVNDKKYMFDNVDDITVVFKLINENNHARALLTYKNGILIYDVVQAEKGG